MGPGEVIFMFILFVIAPAVLFNGIAKVKKAGRGTGTGGEMRASELKSMIQTAVHTATAPLAARITDLEERLGDETAQDLRERLDAGRVGPPALADAFDPDAEFDEPLFGSARAGRTRA